MPIDGPLEEFGSPYARGPLETDHSFSWPLLDLLPEQLASAGGTSEAYASALREAQANLKARFEAEEPVETLVRARARLLDVVLREAWRTRLPQHDGDWTLVAVGGYGRGELHPFSDVDILILVPAALDEAGLRKQAVKDGMRPLRLAGVQRVALGQTVLDEVLASTPALVR